jgi:lipase chaperone LimK
MIRSMSDYKADQERFFGQIEEKEQYLAEERRKREDEYAKKREKALRGFALLGIKQDLPERLPED